MQSRRLLWLLAIVALIGVSTKALAASFPDADRTPYRHSFAYLKQKGLVQGYHDGSARPYGLLNRAEAIKVLTTSSPALDQRVQHFRQNLPPLPLFNDIAQDKWYIPYVEAAFEAGVTKGYPDGSLRPGQVLTVEEAVVLLMRVHKIADNNTTAQLASTIENRSGQWYTGAINAAVKRNLILPQNPGLRLGTPITRGQFFEMVYRLMRIQATGDVAFKDGADDPRTQAVAPIPAPRPTISQPQPAQVTTARPHASEKYFSITMPKLGITDMTVSHPADPFSHQGVLEPLSTGVGHLFSYPGAGGKIMIYGHSSGYAWDISKYTKAFRKVNQLEPGDEIYITYDGQHYTYQVTFEQTIDANDTSPFNDNGSGEELILYTCWPPDSIAQRYLVHAQKISESVNQ